MATSIFFFPKKNGVTFRRRVSSSPGNEDFIPSTVEEIFMDYIGRRLGFFRAFFRDVVSFYSTCHPDKENLCLYAHPNGSWEVIHQPVGLAPKLPKPVLGIYFARDGMRPQDWLELVAAHSDSWLLSLASFFSARLSRDQRTCLFNMINDLPTLLEEVTKYGPG